MAAPTRKALISTTAVIRTTPAGEGETTRFVFLGQTFSVNEDVVRLPVAGIGDFYLRDLLAVRWSGQLTLDVQASSFIYHPTGGVKRNFRSTQSFANWHTYFRDSVTIELWDNTAIAGASLADIDASGRGDFTAVNTAPVAKITDARWVSDGLDLPDQAIATRRTSFVYLRPIIGDSIAPTGSDGTSDDGDNELHRDLTPNLTTNTTRGVAQAFPTQPDRV